MAPGKKEYDAVVVGSGPNGLAAAILLQRQGLSVIVLEGKETIGGGLRTSELTLPGFHHDVCSAIHPLAVASPFLSTLPLEKFGLDFIYPTLAAAHPFDDGSAAILDHSLDNTARSLGTDEHAYRRTIEPIVRNWDTLLKDILGPLSFPRGPVAMTRFGLDAIQPATWLARRFKDKKARGLFGGMAAHSILPLDKLATSAIGLVLMSAAHAKGWPLPKGGSSAIAHAMAAYFISLGGRIETNVYVKSLAQLPSAHAVFFDITPKQLLEIAGHKLSYLYRSQLQRYRYGMGVFKIDWALADKVPFTAQECRLAGTVHIGGTLEEIVQSEKDAWKGRKVEKPYILLAQQSVFDKTRAPEGKHTAWAYCHVPNGSTVDMTDIIERQIERFAPGFRDRILARSVMNTAQMELYNPNYIGGDINGGAITISQLFTRPALRLSPYKTSARGLYICSSSTPPGGGVHGMCGYHAGRVALREIFNTHIKL